MKIRVTMGPGGRIFAEPDPVRVLAGEPIIWEFVSDVPNQPMISWLVYFMQSPFAVAVPRFAVDSQELARPQRIGRIPAATHLGQTQPVVAQQPGDYKYGISATATRTRRLLGDDDPLLTVLP